MSQGNNRGIFSTQEVSVLTATCPALAGYKDSMEMRETLCHLLLSPQAVYVTNASWVNPMSLKKKKLVN